MLLPEAGEDRRQSLRIVATATAACDKAVAISSERRRPTEKIYDGWIDWCREQLDAALTELEAFRTKSWPNFGRLMQAEITTACMLAYVRRIEPQSLAVGKFPNLESLSVTCEAMPEFRACPLS